MAQTIQQLAARINANNESEDALFNSFCNSKLYDGREVDLVDPIFSDIQDQAADVDALSEGDLGDLNDLLDKTKQLSDRPC